MRGDLREQVAALLVDYNHVVLGASPEISKIERVLSVDAGHYAIADLEEALGRVLAGEVEDVQIAGFLVALRTRPVDGRS